MENCPDGCYVDTSTASTAIEPPAPKFRECSRNDLKLAKNISNTFQNFNEGSNQPVPAVIDENNSKIDQKFTSSDEPVAKNTVKPLREDFHASATESTSKLHENLFQNEDISDNYAYDRFEYAVPTPKQIISNRLVATSIMVVENIHGHGSGKLLRVLFDSGGDRTMIHRNALPKGVNPMALDKRARMNTLAGTYESGGEVLLKNLRLPEFDKNRNIENQRALVFNADCRYDVILGNDFINRVGIDIRGSNETVEWLGNVIPMHALPTPDTEEDFNAFAESYLIELEK